MFNSVFKTGIYAHYTVSSTPSFTNTPWTIYNAKSTKTKQPCSLFKFDKKLFEQYVYSSSNNSFNNLSRSTYKMILAEATNYIRAYVNNMIKFKHPNILSVIEPLEERQNSMIFVTELVSTDLQNFVRDQISKGDYSENHLILINGLSQVCGAMEFLHNNANVIHLNLIPSSIFITEKLDFKLSGFNFIEKYDPNNSSYNFIMSDERFPKFLSINYDYSDPSLVIDHELSYANDMFSLGCLIYHLLNDKPGRKIMNSNNDMYDYKAAANKVRTGNIKYHFSEDFLNASFKKLIDNNSNMRFSIEEFKSSSFFNNELLNSLDFINNFNSKTLLEKNVFLKGFNARNYFAKFPKFILIDKFLPILKETIASISNLVIFPITLTCILRIGKNLSNLSYINLLLEVFKPIMIKTNSKKVELNIICFTEIEIIILDHLKTILSKINTSTPASFKKVEKSFLVPLINHILADGAMSIEQIQNEANSNAIQNAFNTVKTLGQVSPEKLKIQEKFLSNLSLIISTLSKQNEANASSGTDNGVVGSVTNSVAGVANALSGNISTIKFIENEIFPKVSQLFKTTASLTIRVEVINNFIILVRDRSLSSTFAAKNIIPMLIGIKQKNNQLVLKGLFDFYSLYYNIDDLFDKELLVGTILPELLKLAFNSNELTIEKFNEFFTLILQFEKKLKEKQVLYLQKFDEKNTIKNQSMRYSNNDNDLNSPLGSPINDEQAATFESILGGNNNGSQNFATSNSSNDVANMNSMFASSINLDSQQEPKKIPKSTPGASTANVLTPSRKPSSNTIRHQPLFGAMTPTNQMGSPSSVDAPSFGMTSPTSTFGVMQPTLSTIEPTKSTTTTIPGNSSSSNIDWSLESTKINSGRLTMASNNVLKPKTKSVTSGTATSTNNFPPGFSSGLIQPTKPNNNNNNNNNNNSDNNSDIFKKASDDFFDSFI